MSTKIPGSLATKKEFFGEFSRYAVFAVYSRFGGVHWMVSDAETLDKYGLPEIIRQGDTKDAVMVCFDA